MTKQKTISQGAEAKIILKDNQITKHRISKSYRIKEIDEKITKLRTRAEAKIMQKLSTKINVPKIISSDEKTKTIEMEFIQGEKISQCLDSFELKKQKQIIKQIAKSVAEIHKKNIAHGDLTTSNMILYKEEIYIIDFGLAFQNSRYEDKAVDIHLFKQALEAKHWKNWETLYKEFIKTYKTSNKQESEKVLNQLIKVEKRGRYRY